MDRVAQKEEVFSESRHQGREGENGGFGEGVCCYPS